MLMPNTATIDSVATLAAAADYFHAHDGETFAFRRCYSEYYLACFVDYDAVADMFYA